MLTRPDLAELRDNVELLCVNDGDEKCVAQLAELMPLFIEGSIPGFGINHTDTAVTFPGAIHNAHQNLLLQALGKLQPGVNITKKPVPVNDRDQGWSRGHDLGMHFDGYDPHWRDEYGLELEGLDTHWVLHTAASGVAQVRLVSSRAGAFQPQQGRQDIGDGHLYLDTFGKLRPISYKQHPYGYDDLEGLGEKNLFDIVDKGSFDPLLTDPEVYNFTQNTFDSVVFKISSMIGPATAHDFKTIGNATRKILTSSTILST